MNLLNQKISKKKTEFFKNYEKEDRVDDAIINDRENFLDFKNMRIPDHPSPESIMGIAAAAATAASVFLQKKRKDSNNNLCTRCCLSNSG